MALTLFASDALEIFHLGGDNWRADEAEMVQLCYFTA